MTALRIKSTRENADFLALGLVRKLFQVPSALHHSSIACLLRYAFRLREYMCYIVGQLQQALRHISFSISYVGKLRRFVPTRASSTSHPGPGPEPHAVLLQPQTSAATSVIWSLRALIRERPWREVFTALRPLCWSCLCCNALTAWALRRGQRPS